MRPLARFAFLAASLNAISASAAPILYNTEAYSPPADGFHGTPVFTFEGVTNGSMEPGGTLRLAEIRINPAALDTPRHFRDEVFRITFEAPELRQSIFDPDAVPPGHTGYWSSAWTDQYGGFLVEGKLNGHVDGEGGADLVFSVDDIEGRIPFPIPADNRKYVNVLPFSTDDVRIPGPIHLTTEGGQPRTVALDAHVVPEPGTLTVFAIAAGALAFRRKFHRVDMP